MKTVKHLVEERNASVVFIPQVTSEFHVDDDRLVHDRIFKQLGGITNVYNISEKLDHYQIKSAYAELDFVIGTRFHSVIFAMTSHVPAVAISYEHKTSGIMSDLNLSDWVIPIEKVTYKLLSAKADQLLESKKQYQSLLEDTLPGYIAQTKDPIKIVASSYNEYTTNNA